MVPTCQPLLPLPSPPLFIYPPFSMGHGDGARHGQPAGDELDQAGQGVAGHRRQPPGEELGGDGKGRGHQW